MTEPPLPGATVHVAGAGDVAELLVLQRCCWVDEAIANDTLAIPALHETLDDVTAWIEDCQVWAVRVDGRLVGAVRARSVGTVWEIGRLMVAPDVGGRGLGGWLLRLAEANAPAATRSVELFTGAASARNLGMYERAGYTRSPTPSPPGVVGLVKRS